MKNLFFLKSPFQLLCGIEAIQMFKLDSNVLIIYDKGTENNFDQLTTLLKKQGKNFEEVITIERELRTLSGWLKGFKSMENIIDNYPKIENLFIGDYQNGLVRHYQNSVAYEDVFLLDDGFATIYIHKQLTHGSLINVKDYVKYIISRGGYKYIARKDVNYFTVFDHYITGEKVYPNRLQNLVSNSEWNITDKIYWLGSPIVEDGIVTKEFYFSTIAHCIKKFKNKDIVYFPHRRENEKKLSKLEALFDFEINRINIPIELFVVLEKLKPNMVVSFFSTALFSLNKILKDTEVLFIPIDEKYLLDRKSHVKNIYEILGCEIKSINGKDE